MLSGSLAHAANTNVSINARTSVKSEFFDIFTGKPPYNILLFTTNQYQYNLTFQKKQENFTHFYTLTRLHSKEIQ